jgi:hypothetical protein
VTQVATAHARCFDGEDYLTLTRRRIGEILKRECSISEKNDAAHDL